MKTFLFFSAFLVFGTSFAQSHDHLQFPEDALIVLEGTNPVDKKHCYLFIMSIDYPGGEVSASNMVVTAQTSFQHGRETAPTFTLSQLNGRPQFLSGQSGRSQLAIEFANAELDFMTVQSYSLRWQHGNHIDNAKCIQLKEHEYEHE